MDDNAMYAIAGLSSIAVFGLVAAAVVSLVYWLTRRDGTTAATTLAPVIGLAIFTVLSFQIASWGRHMSESFAAALFGLVFWLARRDVKTAAVKLALVAGLVTIAVSNFYIAWGGDMTDTIWHRIFLFSRNREAAACQSRLVSVAEGWTDRQLADVLSNPVVVFDEPPDLNGWPVMLRDSTRRDWPPRGGYETPGLAGLTVLQICTTYRHYNDWTKTLYVIELSDEGVVSSVATSSHG